MKYKLVKFNGSYSIQRISDNTSFIPNSKNAVYQQFVDDIYEQGTGIVEGANIQTQVSYVGARVAEYPPIEDQLDKIYHSGVDAWKADIKVIKDKYPKTQVGVTTVGTLPSWVQTDADELRKTNYLKAVERLKEPRLKLGTPYVEINWDPSQNNYIEVTKYKDVPAADDPYVVRDEAERDAAQATIDATPQSIIDSINT